MSVENKNTNQSEAHNLAGAPFETKGIFSEHFLKSLRKTPGTWLTDRQVKESFALCKEIIDKRGHALSVHGNEADVKSYLIDRVLSSLGYFYLLEKRSPGSLKITPDYLLFKNEEDKDRALGLPTNEKYSLAIGLLEAKKYGHPLGAVSRKETPGRFPHNQVRDYLQAACQPDGKPYFDWAILTNGAKWRLYTRQAHPSAYFEINLEKVTGNIENFKLFYLLFRSQSFIPDNGKTFLSNIRSESLDKQAALENDLRERIFNVVEILANGFFSFEPNKIDKNRLYELYETSLVFLYRLLFILYAEGRGLLPAKESGKGVNKYYRKRYSMSRFKKTLNNNFNSEEDDFTDIYGSLSKLFSLIDGSDERLNKRCNVPQYNGGLFDPAENPLLTNWKVGDYTLSEVLKNLIYMPLPSKSGKKQSITYMDTIDYSDLEVRQLGSIYEGLLEHHLILSNGKLKLDSDKTQRKSSGSYYTPDYIVRYIVEQTLQPLIDRIEKSEAVKSAKAQHRKDNSFAEAAFSLKILDPAMGSGHFLVRATEFLADQVMYHQTTELAVQDTSPGVSHEEQETAYWRRRVVESCIFGVDLNPLAVELAKLSLWLTCISSDQPLNFLDHHLRCGNSLIGSSIPALKHLRKQDGKTASLFELNELEASMKAASESIEKIKSTASADVKLVKDKESIWKSGVLERLAPFRAIADLRTSFEFGLQIDDQIYQDIASNFIELRTSTPCDDLLSKHEDLWRKHLELKENYKYFHWELEFPDVFTEGSEETGFDAVIGNPPYVRQESLKEVKAYFKDHFKTYHGVADLYVYFIEKSVNLLGDGNFFGFIVANKWLRTNYGAELRKWLKNNNILEIVDLGDLPVFHEATTYPCILRVQKSTSGENVDISNLKKLKVNENGVLRVENSFRLKAENLRDQGWNLAFPETHNLLEKIVQSGQKLEDYIDGKVYRGILTGLNRAFVIDRETRDRLIAEDPANSEIIKPFLEGKDIKRYASLLNRKYLIFTRRGIAISSYPAIERYLGQFKSRLIPKPSDWSGKWEGRKQGGYEWYEIQDAIDYYEEFQKPKIVYPNICRKPEFTFDNDGLLANQKCFIIPIADLYLLGILNSQLNFFLFKNILPKLRGGFYEPSYVFFKNFPIRRIDFSSSIDHARHSRMIELVQKMLDLNKHLSDTSFANEKDIIQHQINQTDSEIDRLVYDLYDLTEEEIRIIEEELH